MQSHANPCERKASRKPQKSILYGMDNGGNRWVVGGQGGIRTHGELAPSAVFKTAAFDHSATCPHSHQGLVARVLALRI